MSKFDKLSVLPYSMPDYEALIRQICEKYNLAEATIATTDGLPVASNSNDPELSSALAPEMLKSRGNGCIVFMLNSELVFYAKPNGDVDIDRLKFELERFIKQ
jgi:hypothetical protein